VRCEKLRLARSAAEMLRPAAALLVRASLDPAFRERREKNARAALLQIRPVDDFSALVALVREEVSVEQHRLSSHLLRL
jgi:hypothetical protein